MQQDTVELIRDQKAIGGQFLWKTMFHAMLFVFGFSTVFVIGWGGAATVFGQVFRTYQSTIAQVGGVIVILLGLASLDVVSIPWFNYDTRPQWQGTGPSRSLSSVSLGVFFAAGWTPCIGPTLGAILTLGVSQDTTGQAMVLASGYAIGLGVPFLIIALGIDRAIRLMHRFRRHLKKMRFFSGGLLIIMGLMLLTNQLTLIAIWAQRNGLYLDLPVGNASAPTYLIAMLAGLLSFLSPCVLPLVPVYIGYLGGYAAQ